MRLDWSEHRGLRRAGQGQLLISNERGPGEAVFIFASVALFPFLKSENPVTSPWVQRYFICCLDWWWVYWLRNFELHINNWNFRRNPLKNSRGLLDIIKSPASGLLDQSGAWLGGKEESLSFPCQSHPHWGDQIMSMSRPMVWPESLLPGHDAVYRTSQARAPRPVHLSKMTNNEDIALIQIVSFLGGNLQKICFLLKRARHSTLHWEIYVSVHAFKLSIYKVIKLSWKYL